MKPKCNTNDCEVVESLADGQRFWYCRTCKDEVEELVGVPFCINLESNVCLPRNKKWHEDARLKLNQIGELVLNHYETREYYERCFRKAISEIDWLAMNYGVL